MLKFFFVEPAERNHCIAKNPPLYQSVYEALINIVLGSLAVFTVVGSACLAFRTVFPM